MRSTQTQHHTPSLHTLPTRTPFQPPATGSPRGHREVIVPFHLVPTKPPPRGPRQVSVKPPRGGLRQRTRRHRPPSTHTANHILLCASLNACAIHFFAVRATCCAAYYGRRARHNVECRPLFQTSGHSHTEGHSHTLICCNRTVRSSESLTRTPSLARTATACESLAHHCATHSHTIAGTHSHSVRVTRTPLCDSLAHHRWHARTGTFVDQLLRWSPERFADVRRSIQRRTTVACMLHSCIYLCIRDMRSRFGW